MGLDVLFLCFYCAAILKVGYISIREKMVREMNRVTKWQRFTLSLKGPHRPHNITNSVSTRSASKLVRLGIRTRDDYNLTSPSK